MHGGQKIIINLQLSSISESKPSREDELFQEVIEEHKTLNLEKETPGKFGLVTALALEVVIPAERQKKPTQCEEQTPSWDHLLPFAQTSKSPWQGWAAGAPQEQLQTCGCERRSCEGAHETDPGGTWKPCKYF